MHEYHEISDDDTPTVEKVSIIGSSLLDEMDMMFNSLKTSDHTTATVNGHHHPEPQSPSGFGPTSSAADAENRKNHNFNASTMRPSGSHRSATHVAPGSGSVTLHRPPGHKFGGGKRGGGVGGNGGPMLVACANAVVKPISIKDERILNQAIDYVNEISARSMSDLAAGGAAEAASSQSPKRKFSFRFPQVVTKGSGGGGGASSSAYAAPSSVGERDEAAHGGGGGTAMDRDDVGADGGAASSSSASTAPRTRNFTDELKKATDLQVSAWCDRCECRDIYRY